MCFVERKLILEVKWFGQGLTYSAGKQEIAQEVEETVVSKQKWSLLSKYLPLWEEHKNQNT